MAEDTTLPPKAQLLIKEIEQGLVAMETLDTSIPQAHEPTTPDGEQTSP